MKKSILSIFIFISLYGFIGCSDFLEEDNKGGIGNEDFYSTVNGYNTLKTATYSQLRELYKGTPILELDGTDLYLKGYNVNSIYADYKFESNASALMDLYKRCYTGIQYANAGLHFIDLPPLAEADKKVTEAELRFLRAFYHFLLVEQMGGIVINSEYTDAVRLSMPRSTLAESYQFIISEMEAALPILKTAAQATAGQVNQDVANHYLAKVYLTRGWDLKANADFTKAITYADQVISSKGGITQSFANVWDPTKENNQEFIFSVQFSNVAGAIGNANNDGNNQCSLFATFSGGSSPAKGNTPAIDRKQTALGYLPVHAVHMNFTPNDNRYQTTFMPFFLYSYYNYYKPATWATEKVRMYFPRLYSENVDFTKADTIAWKAQLTKMGLTPDSKIYLFPITNNQAHYVSQVNGINKDERLPVVRKFDDLENISGTILTRTASMRDVVIARLAETFFLKAEAQIALGLYADAANTVQIVINRPGNKIDAAGADLPNRLIGTTDKTSALEALLVESGLEQLGEFNGRWQLLRRTGMLRYMLAKYNTDYAGRTEAQIAAERYNLRPIPEDAITLNDALTEADQNPGF
jgi:starch-binding outer membrane protein, SusD/RagB family